MKRKLYYNTNDSTYIIIALFQEPRPPSSITVRLFISSTNYIEGNPDIAGLPEYGSPFSLQEYIDITEEELFTKSLVEKYDVYSVYSCVQYLNNLHNSTVPELALMVHSASGSESTIGNYQVEVPEVYPRSL